MEATNSISTDTLKRSAKRFHGEATVSGWTLNSASSEHGVTTLKYSRSDMELQQEALDATKRNGYYGGHSAVAKVVAKFDADGGAYYGATFSQEDDTYINSGDALGEKLSALAGPSNNILRYQDNVLEAASSERKQAAAEKLTADYLESAEGDYGRRRTVQLAEYEAQPVVHDGSSNIHWFIAAAEAEADRIIAKQLAARALHIEGVPTEWDGEVPSAPMTLEAAIQRVCNDAIGNSDYRGNEARIIAAVGLVQRGY